MSIYRKKRIQSKVYRTVYEQTYGPIPKEANGRSYEVHHIDGNSENNDPKNLIALTLQDHYDIHYQQQDYIACYLIAGKLNKSPEELFTLKSKANLKRVSEGTHNLLKRKDGSSVSADRVQRGEHPFLTRIDGSSLSKDRVINGTNPFSKTGQHHPKYIHTIYRFKNTVTGEIIDATYYEFRTKFNLDPSNVRKIILKHSNSLKGWRVIPSPLSIFY